jgi:hypothetical protein
MSEAGNLKFSVIGREEIYLEERGDPMLSSRPIMRAQNLWILLRMKNSQYLEMN